MRDRASRKKARDKERLNLIAGQGPRKPNRDKRMVAKLARAEAEAQAQQPRPARKSACTRHPAKLRWTDKPTAERWARHFTQIAGKPQRAYHCTACDGYHLTSRYVTSDGHAA